MDKCSCGKPKEEWQDVCKSCYAKKMGGSKKKPNKDNLILKQTCLKVAGNVLEGKTANEVIDYAKQLYQQFQSW